MVNLNFHVMHTHANIQNERHSERICKFKSRDDNVKRTSDAMMRSIDDFMMISYDKSLVQILN